ncbi:hypothetical protein M3Y99_00848800 [Aphelenchoides fujianensis]|nr:hypothetical protein M3Y99_00848800 [Aphelenchoides fujianensis]
MILLYFMCLIGVMAGIFMMMRGCFCDCFGGFKNPFGTEPRTELNPEAVRRCLSAVNKYEENQQKRWGVPESRHPLIPSVSEGCAPYATTVIPAGRYEIVPPPPRNCSPPPSYRSVQGSFEHLPGNTKL